MEPELSFESIYHSWANRPGGIDGSVEAHLLASIYRGCARKAIEHDELFMAMELAQAGVRQAEACGESTVPFHQLLALALARSGSVKKAYHLLLRLSSVARDPESAGLLARTFRDIAWAEPDPARRRNYFLEAFHYSSEAYARSEQGRAAGGPANYYNAIQAAQFAFFADDPRSYHYLLEAEKECLLEERQGNSDPKCRFWRAVTRAEIELIRGEDLDRTRKRYREANRLGKAYFADLRACWAVAREILKHHARPGWYPLTDLFVPPPQVIFTGHQFDLSPDRNRFPARFAGEALENIRVQLAEWRPSRVYTSFSFGADLLFIEAALELGIPVTLVLAFDMGRSLSEFRATVERWAARHPDADSEAWHERADKVVRALQAGFEPMVRARPSNLAFRHRIHEIAFPIPADSTIDPSPAYAYTNRLMAGLALLEARQSAARVYLMTVQNETGSGQSGGTSDFIRDLGDRLARIHNCFPTP